MICPTDGPAPFRCDDSGFGRGTGGQLRYQLQLRRNQALTVWFAVAGSDIGLGKARAEYARALSNPDRLLKDKIASRKRLASNTVVDLPGDRLLQSSVEWSKQNLADSILEARDLRVRDVDEGRAYPPAAGVVPLARWTGAGFPDYPWLFATDGEYTAFASVAAGQFDVVRAHLRALRDVSDLLNARSGKVVHEVAPTGDVYFGANSHAGNTDETVKFPSAVALLWRWTGNDAFRDEMYDFAVRNLQYVYRVLDTDGDGWPEGLGNVERAGMGREKLDSTVYLVRGLRDLADMAASKGDTDDRHVGSRQGRGHRGPLRVAVVVRRGRQLLRRLDRRPGQPRQRQHEDLPAPLDRRRCRWRPSCSCQTAPRARWPPPSTRTWHSISASVTVTRASSGSSIPAPVRRRRRRATRARRATASCRRWAASGRRSH